MRALRARYLVGDYERLSGGARFADGSLWFANAYEVKLTVADSLADGVPVVGIFSVLAMGVHTYALFDEQTPTRWVWAGVTACVFVLAVAALWWQRSRAWRAVERMDLGSLLLDHTLVIISHGRYLLFDRAIILRHDLLRSGQERGHVVRYETAGGQKYQELTGFGNNPEAASTLDRWIAEAAQR